MLFRSAPLGLKLRIASSPMTYSTARLARQCHIRKAGNAFLIQGLWELGNFSGHFAERQFDNFRYPADSLNALSAGLETVETHCQAGAFTERRTSNSFVGFSLFHSKFK